MWYLPWIFPYYVFQYEDDLFWWKNTVYLMLAVKSKFIQVGPDF